ncbi:hypothetical protein L9F63_015695, partial [Diploptera punctata]
EFATDSMCGSTSQETCCDVMRRPTLCSNVTTVEDCYSPVDVANKEESRYL